MAERNCMVDRRGTLEFSPWKRNETKTFERKRDVFVYGRSTEMRQKCPSQSFIVTLVYVRRSRW